MTINVIDHLAAASDAAKKVHPKDLRALRKKIDVMIAAEDAKHSAEAKRSARLQAALEDETKRPAIDYARGMLSRLGMTFASAADVHALTDAMRKANMDLHQRVELKKLLSDIGVIS